jgi:hypothetical protein
MEYHFFLNRSSHKYIIILVQKINILFINNFGLIIMIFRVISKCILNLEKGIKKKKKKQNLILPVWPLGPLAMPLTLHSCRTARLAPAC